MGNDIAKGSDLDTKVKKFSNAFHSHSRLSSPSTGLALTSRELEAAESAFSLSYNASQNEPGRTILCRLIRLEPDLQAIFKHSQSQSANGNAEDVPGMNDDGSPNKEEWHSTFPSHAERFSKLLQFVIENSGSSSGQTVPLLIALGRQHAKFSDIHFSKRYWDAFAKVTVTEIMSSSQNAGLVHSSATVKSAWTKIMQFVTDHMKEGYEKEFQASQVKHLPRAASSEHYHLQAETRERTASSVTP